jgi:hypothetical protein
MSERNGDRARFQKNRKRKLHYRQSIQALIAGRKKAADDAAAATTAPAPPDATAPHVAANEGGSAPTA